MTSAFSWKNSGFFVCVCCSVMSNSLWPHGLCSLLCPWNSPGKNTGAGCHAFLQRIFLTQGLKLSLLHWEVGSLLLVIAGLKDYFIGIPIKSHHQPGLLECKSSKSRNTSSNKQNWPWSTEWSRAKANRVLPRERSGHSKQPLPTAQQKTLHTDITRWSILKSDWLYSLQLKMETLYTVSKNRTVAQIMNSLLPNSDWNWRK